MKGPTMDQEKQYERQNDSHQRDDQYNQTRPTYLG